MRNSEKLRKEHENVVNIIYSLRNDKRLLETEYGEEATARLGTVSSILEKLEKAVGAV